MVSFQKMFIIHKCSNIPMPDKDEMTVLSRKVRICLFDGESVSLIGQHNLVLSK